MCYPIYGEGNKLSLKLMWVHLIVRYRDTARSFCGNCKINWELLAQGREASLQIEEINFLSLGPSLPIPNMVQQFQRGKL